MALGLAGFRAFAGADRRVHFAPGAPLLTLDFPARANPPAARALAWSPASA